MVRLQIFNPLHIILLCSLPLGNSISFEDDRDIRSMLYRYPLSVDTKNYTGLFQVFTPSSVIAYGDFLGALHGTEQVANNLNKSLTHVTTQLLLNIMTITPYEAEQEQGPVHVTSYVRSTHLGQGLAAGQEFKSYIRYDERAESLGKVGVC
jgi:hypothetical protein